MKVWEYINQLKGTEATQEQIKKWSYMNRVPPCVFGGTSNGLELDKGLPVEFQRHIELWCQRIHMDCDKCYSEFFELDIPELGTCER